MVDKNKFAEEEALGYRIEIFGKHVHVTDAMKNYMWDKLVKVERFHNHIIDVHVTLDIEKLDHIVTILVKFDHIKINASATTTDMYVSIDKAVDRLNTLLLKWKDRIQEHHRKKLSEVDMQVNVIRRPYDELEEINAEIEASAMRFKAPQLISTEKKPLKTLTVDEALMKMDLSGDHFMVYRSEEDHKLKVIYLRSDGNYGILLPE